LPHEQGLQFAGEGEHLFLVPTAGAGLRRLADVEGHDGAWSPDGHRLALAKEEALFIAQGDGSSPRKIASLPGKADWIRWAPDASRIRFTVVDPGTTRLSLWECHEDGTHLRRLAFSASKRAQECCGEWTPDGSYFFFRIFDERRSDIWVMRERRSYLPWASNGLIRLTSGPLNSLGVIPSVDGKKLFSLEATQGSSELAKYDVRTGQLTSVASGIFADMADLSSDRQWMVYTETRDGTLWRCKVDGSQRLQLTYAPMFIFGPHWSPDGKQVAFMGHMPDGPWKNYVLPATGGNPHALPSQERNAADATWSPDGNSILFGRPPDDMGEPGTPKAIHLLDLKSGAVTTLPGSEGLFSPRWSPNGRYAVAMPLNQSALLLYDFVAGRWSTLVSDQAVAVPVWSRDSAYVYFLGVGGNVWRVGRLRPRLEKVFDRNTVSAAYGCDLLTTDWDEKLLFTCSAHEQDIYRLDLALP
jgi:Tol biopolymer transport system component